MWKLMKSHPVTTAIGAAILLAAIAGVIIGVITKGGWKDRGMLQTKTGKPYYWAKPNLPLAVWLHPELRSDYVQAYRDVQKYLRVRAGMTLMDFGTEMPEGFKPSRLGEGQVLIAPADAFGLEVKKPDHGVTSLTVIEESGEVKRAVVVLPEAGAERVYSMMLHEMMHVLGFDHDESTSSLMHPRLQNRPQVVTDEDLARLKLVGVVP